MSSEAFSVKIFKFDPSIDATPYYKEFLIETGTGQSVLDLLKEIYRNHDSDISFRFSCRLGKCGVCAVRVNGKPVLACQTTVENGDVVIEPLKGFPVIKDLIVERETYRDRLKSARPYPDRADRSGGSSVQKLWADPNASPFLCTDCLACMSSCKALSRIPWEFPGPAFFTNLARWHYHPLDRSDRPALAIRSGISHCTACKSCSKVCPKGIDVYKEAIEALEKKP
ncbi:MAG: hypothetical protein DRP87_04320 [Spirochaetes bacterium]|nr:MAG: hypothetical protein DRP87_04320 [Spirochaetota bacterium]